VRLTNAELTAVLARAEPDSALHAVLSELVELRWLDSLRRDLLDRHVALMTTTKFPEESDESTIS
jgi:hypothetical protein